VARLDPFPGWVVTPAAAPRVVAPAYDALTPAERATVAAAEPDSFLNVMRSAEDQLPGDRLDRDELLAASRATLDRLLATGAFAPTPAPAYHLLRMRRGDHVHTGVVGTIPLADVGPVVKLHEETRPEKEHDLVRHLEVVGVASSPVGLVHPGPSPVADVVAAATARPPTVAVTSDDGLVQQVWTVTDAAATAAVRAAFGDVPALYLTDGHHRAAATARFAGGDPSVRLLAVVFPASDLRLHPYHRVVHDVGGRRAGEVVDALRAALPVTELGTATPAGHAPPRGTAFLHLAGRWYALDLADRGRPDDPVEALDVSLVQARVLEPVLGVDDPRTDRRLEYVPGTHGLEELAARAGADGAAFALAATDVGELVAVADAGAVMPPKSTWFEPKLRSGVFLHRVARDRDAVGHAGR
jgi:uncharacterized protein (DUF1015 family)